LGCHDESRWKSAKVSAALGRPKSVISMGGTVEVVMSTTPQSAGYSKVGILYLTESVNRRIKVPRVL